MNDDLKISFIPASKDYKNIVFKWLDEPHVKEFWDNSQEHRNDILNFMDGRKTPTPYFKGIFDYWIGLINNEPYCFLLTSEILKDQEMPDEWKPYLSKIGKTASIDFMIGNKKFLGKGLGALTLEQFVRYLQKEKDKYIDTFMIDPDTNNPRAIHVYEKAGFERVNEFEVTKGYFSGHRSLIMVKKLL